MAFWFRRLGSGGKLGLAGKRGQKKTRKQESHLMTVVTQQAIQHWNQMVIHPAGLCSHVNNSHYIAYLLNYLLT